jgi:hypothetical protein
MPTTEEEEDGNSVGKLLAWLHCSYGPGPANSLSFIPMIFQAISNAPTSTIQIITFLDSKNFSTLHGGIKFQMEQICYWAGVQIPNGF